MADSRFARTVTYGTLQQAVGNKWLIVDGPEGSDPVRLISMGEKQSDGAFKVKLSNGKSWWFHPDSSWGADANPASW